MGRIHSVVAGLLTIALSHPVAQAEQIAVKHIQLPMHRFMVARSDAGKVIAHVEFVQTVQGDEVTMHLIYRFVDGSVDDDTTVYTQRGTFRLVRDHHVQQGPFFAKPLDFMVDASTGQLTSRTIDANGKVRVESKHMDLPNDLANGMVGTLLLNVPHDTRPFRVNTLAPVNGGRLVRLLISPVNDETVHLSGQAYNATVFRVHPDLSSFLRFIARLLGLEPKDVMVWVLEGEDPAVAVVVGQLGGTGPVINSDLVGVDLGQ